MHAIPIVFCALLLLLPMPVPFSNAIPAWSIMMIAGGLVERDGGFILEGHLASFIALAFFGSLALFGVEALDFLWKWLH